MKKIIIFLIPILILSSCEDIFDYIQDAQRSHVYFIINGPNRIYKIISGWNGDKEYPTESSINFVNHDSLKQFIEPLQTLKQEGYELEFMDPWMYRDSLTKKVHFRNEIIAKSKSSDLFISFYFKTERNMIKLVKIEVNHYAYYNIKRGFSLIKTIKKENEDYLKWLIENPNDFIHNINERNNSFIGCKSFMSEESLKIYQQIINEFSKNGYLIYNRKTDFSSGQSVPGLGLGVSDCIVIKSKQNDLYLSFLFSTCNDYQSLIRIIRDKRLYYEYYIQEHPLDAHP